ncbi:MAG: hypothetical protein KDE15_14945 [Erythrobacter sp.]|nr:hypothetical protein [Erythrobacter sp.]
MGPASSSALRTPNGASPAAANGSGEDAYGSLSALGGPKKFKKKPVLVLDPEELERAHLMFQEASAELLGEEVERPVRPAGILGLAAMDDEDATPEDMGESDEPAAAEDDDDLPSADDVLRMTIPRAPVESDPDEDAFISQHLESLDVEHRIFPSLPMKSEAELEAEEEAERAAVRAAAASGEDEAHHNYALPEEDFDQAEWDEGEEDEAEDSAVTASLPPLGMTPTPRAPAAPPAVSEPKPVSNEPAKVPSAYVPQIPPRLHIEDEDGDTDDYLPLPEFSWRQKPAPEPEPQTQALPEPEPEPELEPEVDAAPVAIPVAPVEPQAAPTFQATPTFDDWADFDDFHESDDPALLEPEPEPESMTLREWAEPEPDWHDHAEPGFAAFATDDYAPEPEPAAETVEAGEPAYQEADGSWTAIEDEPVDGYAFMYANNPRARTLHALAEGEANSLRARLLREREEAKVQAEQRRSGSILLRFWMWLRSLFG